MIKKILISGFGGQGVMMMGQMLAYLGNEKGLNTLYFPSYGPETRGGTANCSVTISSEYINSPIFKHMDILIALNQPSFDKFFVRVDNNGIILYNSNLVEKINTENSYGIPINEESLKLGNSKVSNMIMMGALIKKTGLFTFDEVAVVLKKFLGESKAHLYDVNIQAIKLGMSL